jgi:hypothetical protein
MNRRGKRLAFTVAVTGLVVLTGLAILHWGTVHDHVQAWRFQLTTETVMIEPDPALKELPVDKEGRLRFRSLIEPPPGHAYASFAFLRILASASGQPVILALDECAAALGGQIILPTRSEEVGADILRAELETMVWRVLEQRFPRRAYVVIRGQGATP